MAWIILEAGIQGRHILPQDEKSMHNLFHCCCGGYYDEEAGAQVHNAFDGREEFESGLRKPS